MLLTNLGQHHTHTAKQLVRPLRQVLNLHLYVTGHQTRENQGPFTAKRNFEISMVRAIPSRVKRYISGTSKARRTTYGHVMNIATLPDPGARLDREKTPVRRLRRTPQVQSTGHLGQPPLHYKPVQKKSNRRPRVLSCEAMGGEAIAGIVPCCRTLSR